MKVLALAFPGLTLIDLVGPLQAFSMLPGYEVQIVWKQAGPIASDAGITIYATHDYANCWDQADILFVPGNTKALFALLEDKQTVDFVATKGATAKWVTSVCNGSLLLAAAGLLEGYRAASYWYTRESLSLFGATPVEDRVVIDRNRATGGGMTAGVDFGIAMVGQIAGPEFGSLVELLFEYAPSPPFGTGRPELAGAELLEKAKSILPPLMPLERLPALATSRRV